MLVIRIKCKAFYCIHNDKGNCYKSEISLDDKGGCECFVSAKLDKEVLEEAKEATREAIEFLEKDQHLKKK